MKPKRYGTTIRDEDTGRAVPCPIALGELAHELRYGNKVLTQNERYTAASALDVLLSLCGSREIYGARQGDKHVRDVLALIAAGLEV